MSKRLFYSLAISIMLPLALVALVWAFANSSQGKQPTVIQAGVKPNITIGTWGDVVAFPTVTLGFWGQEPDTGPLMLRRNVAVGYPPNGKVYILGGKHRPDGADIGVRWIWEYDPSNNTLTQKNALLDQDPNGSRFVANMAAAVLTDTNGPRIYLVGGSTINGETSTDVRVYDPNSDTLTASDTWPVNPAPVPGGYAVYNNKLYIFGGHAILPSTQLFSDTWVFDPMMPSGQRWTHLTSANLSVPRAYIGGAELDGYIYAIGGDQVISNTATPLSIVERMDPSLANPTWQQVASLPWPKGDMGTWAYDTGSPYEIAGRIMIAGGGYPVPDTSALIYNPTTNAWTTFPDMLRPRRNYGAAQLNGILYAWGGYDVQGNVYNGSNSNMAYNASGPPPPPAITPSATPSPEPTSCTARANYTYTVSTGASIDPGTALVPGTSCQTCVVNLPLPFPVQLYGRSFNTAVVGSTGNMQLGSDDSFWINRPLPWNGFNYSLFPFWSDLDLTGNGHGIYTSIVGNAPDRTFNVEWRGVSNNFEVRLFEDSTGFEFIYGTGSGGSATIGVQKDMAFYTQVGYNVPQPVSGTKYSWTTVVCGTPTPTATGTVPTATNTRTPTFTLTPTLTPTAMPTVCGNVIQNGGFETGTLPPWIVLEGNPQPIVTAVAHTGTYSVLLGTVSGGEPNGNGSIYQQITVPPGGGTLSYWWNGGTTDSITFDWQDAYVTDTSHNVLATIMHECQTTGGWINQTFDMAPYAGQTVDIEFLVHQDGFGDDTYMYVDDVSLANTCATGTPTVPTTNTPTLAPTGTNTPLPPTQTPLPPTATSTPQPTGTTPPNPSATSTPQPTGTTPPSPSSTTVEGTATTLEPTATSDEATATAVEATATPTACTIQFSDVQAGSTFYVYIHCLACNGIISGYPDGTFKPNNDVTRGQTVKMISNAAGWQDPIPPDQWTFQDVPPGSTFWIYVGRFVLHVGGITGYPCGGQGDPCVPPDNRPYFHPNANATRGQIAKIVSNAAGFNNTPTGQQFEDVPVSSTFYLYIYRLSIRGIVQGYSCGGPGEPCVPPGNLPYFRPNAFATRGQTSKIVANTFMQDCALKSR